MIRLIFILSLYVLTVQAQETEKKKLLLTEGEREVLTYNASYVPSPYKDKPWYGRSGFIHPVRTPSGLVVTDDFPEDHLHQHGLMFAWTSAKIDGKKVDFWNSPKKQGRIEHVETVKSGEDKIIVKLRHVHTKGKKENVVLHETWEITKEKFDGVNAFSLKSTQTCAGKEPFELMKYHYGAMCIRGSEDWMKELNVLTSEGKSRAKANHTRPNWVTMNGKVDGKLCGIAAMCHPDNFRAPQPVRVHPEKPYFCFAPIVAGGFKIEQGKPYVSKFLFVTYDGKADVEKLDKIFEVYSKQ